MWDEVWWLVVALVAGLVYMLIEARAERKRKRQSTYKVLRGIAEGDVSVRVDDKDNLIVRRHSPDGGYKDTCAEHLRHG